MRPEVRFPVTLLEGSWQGDFGSLDELLGDVEAIDVRDGRCMVLDADGRVIELSADSDRGPVTARATDSFALQVLDRAARDLVRSQPARWGLIDGDVALPELLSAIWRTTHPSQPHPR